MTRLDGVMNLAIREAYRRQHRALVTGKQFSTAEQFEFMWKAGYAAGQPQWIVASERLPDIGGEYIVAYDPEDGETPPIIETVAEYCFKSHGINEKYEAGKWYHIGSRALPFGDIIAWMPIPSYTESDNTEVSDE